MAKINRGLRAMIFINTFKNKILSLYKALRRSSLKQEKESIRSESASRSEVTSPDFIDYDGMGNQGRFPTTKGR